MRINPLPPLLVQSGSIFVSSSCSSFDSLLVLFTEPPLAIMRPFPQPLLKRVLGHRVCLAFPKRNLKRSFTPRQPVGPSTPKGFFGPLHDIVPSGLLFCLLLAGLTVGLPPHQTDLVAVFPPPRQDFSQAQVSLVFADGSCLHSRFFSSGILDFGFLIDPFAGQLFCLFTFLHGPMEPTFPPRLPFPAGPDFVALFPQVFSDFCSLPCFGKEQTIFSPGGTLGEMLLLPAFTSSPRTTHHRSLRKGSTSIDTLAFGFLFRAFASRPD